MSPFVAVILTVFLFVVVCILQQRANGDTRVDDGDDGGQANAGVCNEACAVVFEEGYERVNGTKDRYPQ